MLQSNQCMLLFTPTPKCLPFSILCAKSVIIHTSITYKLMKTGVGVNCNQYIKKLLKKLSTYVDITRKMVYHSKCALIVCRSACYSADVLQNGSCVVFCVMQADRICCTQHLFNKILFIMRR